MLAPNGDRAVPALSDFSFGIHETVVGVGVTHRGRRQYSLIPVGRSHCTRNVRRVYQNPVQCEVAG